MGHFSTFSGIINFLQLRKALIPDREARAMPKPTSYRFSRREIARHKCLGCGVNVIKIGHYCMLNSDLWERELHLKSNDNMCIRLHREAHWSEIARSGLYQLPPC